MMRRNFMAVAAAMAVSAGPAKAQEIPVIDQASILKQIESIAQLKVQLETLNQQLSQARQLYDSLNKLTDMADVATVLNKPAVRRALPKDFVSIQDLFTGAGSGALAQSAQQFLTENAIDQSDPDAFYARELQRMQKRNAGQLSLGRQIYDAASRRIDGIDELRQQISTAEGAKETADLQARLQAESAFLQTDVLRMQALRMIQQAELRVDEQHRAEDWQRRLQSMKEALE